MININLFSGPGCGKSTTSAGLFYNLKIKGYNVEFVQEYAKELVYSKDFTKLSDQFHIIGEQHHRMKKLEHQVDYLIHDSPFLMGLAYVTEDEHLPKKKFKKLIIDMFNTYENFNIFLVRNKSLQYQQTGRTQNLDEAIKKDNIIMNLLDKNKIQYHEILVTDNIVQDIINLLENERVLNNN